MPSPHNLSENHRKAIGFWLGGLSQTDALIKAGYEPGYAKNAYQVFGREDVKEEIKRRQHQMSTKAGVDADWIVERLKAIADAMVVDVMVLDDEGLPRVDLTKITPQLKRALQGYRVKKDGTIELKVADQLRALDMLARHLGMYQDKMTIEGELSLVERLTAGRNRASGGE